MVGILVWQKGWAPGKEKEMTEERDAVQAIQAMIQAKLWKDVKREILSKGVEIPLRGLGNFSQFLDSSSRISEGKKDLAKFLYFNPEMNSGWFYIAQTVPEKGIAFWAAMVRTFSVQQTDKSAYLLYGIIDENAKGVKGQQGADFQFYLVHGSFFEDANRINLSFKGRRGAMTFYQTKNGLDEFKLNANLPWCGPLCRQGKGVDRLQIDKRLTLDRPIIYESGDGVIPMAQGLDSLYVSLPLNEGFWVDFQKFNIPLASVFTQSFRWDNIKPNHRWASFMLSQNVGALPAGTVGVYWEIFDQKGNRQPGGYTNFDLLIPGKPQKTVDDFQIEEIKYSEKLYAGKKYLKKWRLFQKDLGVDLVFETLVDSAVCDLQIPIANRPNSPSYANVMNFNFYEGMTKVFDSLQPEKQVGAGMLEQTHNEKQDYVN